MLERIKGKKFGIDIYEKEIQRYIVKIDSAYKIQAEKEKTLPLSLEGITKMHRNKTGNNEYELPQLFLPKQ